MAKCNQIGGKIELVYSSNFRSTDFSWKKQILYYKYVFQNPFL